MVWIVNRTNRLASVQANGRARVEGSYDIVGRKSNRYQLVSACKVVVECI
jgi:hypothetical protein